MFAGHISTRSPLLANWNVIALSGKPEHGQVALKSLTSLAEIETLVYEPSFLVFIIFVD